MERSFFLCIWENAREIFWELWYTINTATAIRQFYVWKGMKKSLNSTEFCLILQRISKQIELQVIESYDDEDLIGTAPSEKRFLKMKEYEAGVSDAVSEITKVYQNTKGVFPYSNRSMSYEEAQTLVLRIKQLPSENDIHSFFYKKAIEDSMKSVKRTYESRNQGKLNFKVKEINRNDF